MSRPSAVGPTPGRTRRHATPIRAALCALALVTVAAPRAAHAQGIRLRGTTWARYVELRPFVEDSVPIGSVTGDGVLRQAEDGRVVRCTAADPYCHFLRSGERVSSVPVLQDLELSAWGLGQGLSVHATGRVRGTGGTRSDAWPRSDDHFDALEAYVRLDRARWGGTLGRQWVTNGLGVYNFDGAMLALRPMRRLQGEVWGGWSLVRGLNESFTSGEIGSVDDLPPGRAAYLLGASLAGRPIDAVSLRGVYQREIRTNRSGLYSERVALDGTWRLGRGAIEGELTHDLATGQVNDAGLRGRVAGPWRTALSLEARRSRPFFELWTIWGAFSPVGFDEVRSDVAWSASPRLRLAVRGAYRRWQPTDAGFDFAPLNRDAWRAGGDVQYRFPGAWSTFARYDADIGFGASRGEGDLGVRYEPVSGRWNLGAAATAWQSIYEFRVGTERVTGFVVDGGVRLRPDLRLAADFARYTTGTSNAAPVTDWGQNRASLRVEWTVGADPGRPRGTPPGGPR